MRVLLVSPNAKVPDATHLYPLSLAYLGVSLRKVGHEVMMYSLFNMEENKANKVLSELLEKINPDVVGMNCITQNRGGTYQFITMSKQFNPDIVVVLGGPHATFMHEQLLDNFPVDFIVLGEGELAMIELLEDLKNTQQKIRKASKIIDLNSLGIPDHSYAAEWITEHKKAHIITSRGCPGQCSFCSTGFFWGNNIRLRSAELIADELEMLVKTYGVRDFLFHDDTFNLTINRAYKISEELIKRNLNINWSCLGRVNPVTKDMLIFMKQSGCSNIMFGIETGAEKLMEDLGKNITKKQIRNAFRLCEEVNMDTTAFLIVGLPGETDETVKETKELLNELSMTCPPAISLMYVYPGTKVYEQCKEKGLIADSYWLESTEDFILGDKKQMTIWASKLSIAPRLRGSVEWKKQM